MTALAHFQTASPLEGQPFPRAAWDAAQRRSLLGGVVALGGEYSFPNLNPCGGVSLPESGQVPRDAWELSTSRLLLPRGAMRFFPRPVPVPHRGAGRPGRRFPAGGADVRRAKVSMGRGLPWIPHNGR